ncbi:MAG: hypothetical protein ACLQVJ_11765 [Syntrophobacteraceae bacterium]
MKKPALIGGLLLVLVLGLATFPDFALRLYPDLFLNAQLRGIRRNTIRMQARFDCDEATLSALDRVREHGVPHFYEGFSYPSETGVKQATRRVKAQRAEDYADLTELDYLRQRLERLRVKGEE